MAEPLLAASAVSYTYSHEPVLREVDLTVRAGEMIAIRGPSGAGKSTLLLCCAGIVLPDRGQVRFDGEALSELSASERARRRLTRMGFVFQSSDLIPELPLLDNVSLPLEVSGTPRRTARGRAAAELDRLGIDEAVAARLPGAVSGGQAQRAAVARALVHAPRMVFADEPTGALDSVSGTVVMESLSSARARGVAVLVVTHDDAVAAFADRVAHLVDGRMVA